MGDRFTSVPVPVLAAVCGVVSWTKFRAAPALKPCPVPVGHYFVPACVLFPPVELCTLPAPPNLLDQPSPFFLKLPLGQEELGCFLPPTSEELMVELTVGMKTIPQHIVLAINWSWAVLGWGDFSFQSSGLCHMQQEATIRALLGLWCILHD